MSRAAHCVGEQDTPCLTLRAHPGAVVKGLSGDAESSVVIKNHEADRANNKENNGLIGSLENFISYLSHFAKKK